MKHFHMIILFESLVLLTIFQPALTQENPVQALFAGFLRNLYFSRSSTTTDFNTVAQFLEAARGRKPDATYASHGRRNQFTDKIDKVHRDSQDNRLNDPTNIAPRLLQVLSNSLRDTLNRESHKKQKRKFNKMKIAILVLSLIVVATAAPQRFPPRGFRELEVAEPFPEEQRAAPNTSDLLSLLTRSLSSTGSSRIAPTRGGGDGGLLRLILQLAAGELGLNGLDERTDSVEQEVVLRNIIRAVTSLVGSALLS
ncbi:CLUMA_CG001395, isoform A [Clunio marinus]|uniref:CLUMA_CG001395, isoform A n=1 Tax=Clunio marinus TaxID=568069 RepID=A0A1J1HHT8_9DIPT|nr:CLUMA_CG001395, isoform A [Clunio marinus]